MPKETRKIVEREELIVDSVTGEVVQQRTVSSRTVSKEPNFIKLYIDTMKSFNGAHDIPTDLILSMSQFITYANGTTQQQLYMAKPMKEKVAQDVGISVSMVDKYIRKMVNAGVLFKTGYRGVYIVNPWLIAKGEWRNIERLRAEFDFTNNTWTYIAEIPADTNS